MSEEEVRSTRANHLRGDRKILLECAQVLALLGRGLVGAVTELGRGIDPFELDLLVGPPAGVDEHGFPQGYDPLLDAGNGALDQKEVVLDDAVAHKATHAVIG